jgi:hypothetical protein
MTQVMGGSLDGFILVVSTLRIRLDLDTKLFDWCFDLRQMLISFRSNSTNTNIAGAILSELNAETFFTGVEQAFRTHACTVNDRYARDTIDLSERVVSGLESSSARVRK